MIVGWPKGLMVKSLRRENGQTLVEFALIAPILFLLLLGIMELGRVIFAYNTISNAAREGARYGIIRPEDVTGIEQAARQLTTGLDQDPSVLQISSTQNGITVCVQIDYEVDLVAGIVIDALGGDPSPNLRAVASMHIE